MTRKTLGRRIADFISKRRLYVGRDPRSLPPGAIILFPIRMTVLSCGLAGLMMIKGGRPPAQGDPVKIMTTCLEQIREKNLAALLAGTLPPDRYLDGLGCLRLLDEGVQMLKREDLFREIFYSPIQAEGLRTLLAELKSFFAEEEKGLEGNAAGFPTPTLETINSRLLILKDILWALEKDILDNIGRIRHLAGAEGDGQVAPAAFSKYLKLNFLLNCLDRLEVRGRDSAGIQLSFTLADPGAFAGILDSLRRDGLHDEWIRRSTPDDLMDGAIRVAKQREGETAPGISLSFTYKTFSIIGELGRNVRELRRGIAGDRIFKAFAGLDTAFEVTFAHTRWASVGSITEENCHPVNNHTLRSAPAAGIKDYPHYGRGNWTISVVLNGDIDNYTALREALESREGLIAPELTTDTKIIPLQVERHLLAGHSLTEAFRRACSDFEGSHAIALVSNLEPSKAFLALKGSGQTIYVGLAEDRYIFSSELYGLVEGTSRFIKMDGERPSPAGAGESGQILVLDQDTGGELEGIQSCFYDGTPLAMTQDRVQTAEITTRDIDRGTYPHFFLKEISESALSVRKTLRGKYRILGRGEEERSVRFNLGEDILPARIRQALEGGKVRQVTIIGHGTAAVAGSAVADAFARYLTGSHIKIEAKVASELSGFALEEDLRDTLVIPITQSGTTTDTNRAVAMAVERGAMVIAIVNRRQSDITTKADGVFYTSDGRDIEMSVASTKAFYSQIVAGHVLALGLAQLLRRMTDEAIADELMALEQAPAMMNRMLEQKDQIRASATRMAGSKKHWAIVGSGPNKAAADEIRIKLSELCYKTISSDIIENKKHIDLSAEPLIIVCAAGNSETVVGDIVKDVAIFKAHKAGVIVFADEGEERFDRIADTVIGIPRASQPLPVILNTLAGHLWGYYAACSIDAEAHFFREFRNHLNLKMVEQEKAGYSLYERIFDRPFRTMVGDFSVRFNERRRQGAFLFTQNRTISDMTLLLKYAAGKLPLEDYQLDFHEEGLDFSPLDLLDVSLGHAIDELSRPVDAIRHQAKTVTVGTSRKEQALQGILFDLLQGLTIEVQSLVTKNIPAILRIQPALATVRGYTLYGIDNLDADGTPGEASTIRIQKRDGVSLQMPSRAEGKNLLMGTKKTIVRTGNIYVGQGKSDGAPIVIIPLLGEGTGVRSLLLIHVTFNEGLSLRGKKDVLGNRYNDIRNLVNEYNLPWEDSYLERIPLASLLGDQVEVIARQVRESMEQKDPSPQVGH